MPAPPYSDHDQTTPQTVLDPVTQRETTPATTNDKGTAHPKDGE